MYDFVNSFYYYLRPFYIYIKCFGCVYAENKRVYCQSFCTKSDNIDRMSCAVWVHMQPILEKAAQDFPYSRTIPFFRTARHLSTEIRQMYIL